MLIMLRFETRTLDFNKLLGNQLHHLHVWQGNKINTSEP
jgi:hypothetical protein